jgi:hypothetical protein
MNILFILSTLKSGMGKMKSHLFQGGFCKKNVQINSAFLPYNVYGVIRAIYVRVAE